MTRKKTAPVSRELNHADYIGDPFRWTMWPYCPLKRGDSSLENKNLGVLLADERYRNRAYRVYHINMFDIPTTSEWWEKTEYTEYLSITDLVRDGWIVD